MASKLAILTPFWRRYELSSKMMRHTHAVALEVSDSVDIELVGVISEQKYVGMCSRYGWRQTWAENEPRPSKNHKALAWIGNYLKPDGVLVLGSDDFADAAYLRAAIDAMKRGVDLWGVRDIVFENGKTGERVHWQGYPEDSPRHGETIGAGRMLSRKFLDACGWAPWDGATSASMDGAMMRTFNARQKASRLRSESTTLAEIGAQLVDVKTDESLTGWERVT